MTAVYVIKRNDLFYTGDLERGQPVFRANKEHAIELSHEEALLELDGDSMPIDAKIVRAE